MTGVSVLDWPTAYTLCSQFIDVEVYLTEKKVLHRDIKPDNVLMKEDGSLCLCDFGDAVKVRHSSDARMDTLPVAAQCHRNAS